MFRLAAFFAPLLFAGSAVAGRAKPTTCNDVPSCVVLAERTPSEFSPNLRHYFQQLSGETLVKGLKYIHPRAKVQARIRQHLFDALELAEGHTKASAEVLLQLAEGAVNVSLRYSFVSRLAADKGGRPVLYEFIERTTDMERRREAMFLYVEKAGVPTSAEWQALSSEKHTSDPRMPLSPDDQVRLNKYVDKIWSSWLAAREEKSYEGYLLLNHIGQNRVYHDRLFALHIAEFKAGKIPSEAEIEAVAGIAKSQRDLPHGMLEWTQSFFALLRTELDAGTAPSSAKVVMVEAIATRQPEFVREMLHRAQSPYDLPRRRIASYYVLLGIHSFEPEEWPTLRNVLLAGASDPDDPHQWSYRYDLSQRLTGLTAAEAKQVAQIAGQPSGRNFVEMKLLAGIAKRFPEYRNHIIHQFVDGPIDDIETWGNLLRSDGPSWIAEVAAKWIRELTPDELRKEDVQERFLALALLIPGMEKSRLPSSRRPIQPFRGIDCGRAEILIREETKREDLVAFGLASPKGKTHPQNENGLELASNPMEEAPAPPPLTARAASARWREFLLARDAIVQNFSTATKH